MLIANEATLGRTGPMNYHDTSKKLSYVPPSSKDVREVSLRSTLEECGREALQGRQLDFLRTSKSDSDVSIFIVGDATILHRPCVSIVGTREVSDEGYARASRLARELSKAGVTIVSGLARGVDTASHTAAIENNGKTVAVIGTPVTKAYPAENSRLQEKIYREHLLVSPFSPMEKVFKGNFPKRNRVMAAISDATVIIEASDTSGTLHQAAECQRLGRWLFITKSVADDTSLTWPARFIGKPKVGVLKSISDLLEAIRV